MLFEKDKDYTEEEVIEMVRFAIRAMLEQGKRSTNSEGCMYRGPNGTKCALGHLIPDELYTRDIEGKNIYAALNAIGLELPLKAVRELGILQRCHDKSSVPFVNEFTARVKNNLPKEYWPDEL